MTQPLVLFLLLLVICGIVAILACSLRLHKDILLRDQMIEQLFAIAHQLSDTNKNNDKAAVEEAETLAWEAEDLGIGQAEAAAQTFEETLKSWQNNKS